MSTLSAPSPTDPRSRRRFERWRAIVEAAATLFAEVGYAGCEMDRVAEALGIAKGTVYLYFKSKQDLFFACVDWGMQQMQQAIRAAIADIEDPFEKVGRAIRAYLCFFESHPQYVELILQERAIFRDHKRSTYFEHRDANRGFWRELYSRLVAEGHLRSDLPVERMLDTLGNLVYGTMFTNHLTGRRTTPDEQYAVLMESVFRGLLPDDRRHAWKLPAASVCGPLSLPMSTPETHSPSSESADGSER